MRLIDANALKNDGHLYIHGADGKDYYEIDHVPTVDATPVVRCKDCKYWSEDIGWCDINSHFVDDNYEPCSPEESPNWLVFSENDYCSYGERRVSE